MTGALHHRGPDGTGFHFEQHVGLGHQRLSIIDLKTGRQPMKNEDGTLWLVLNGEIYNFLELKKELKAKGHVFSTHSDSEVVLHLYEEMGERCVEKLIGMFAFAIWDRKRRRLFLARDRFGMKPLHYFIGKDTFLFASEIKALLQYPGLDKALNFSALDQYFTFLYVLEPSTIFEEIQKLPPAHYLICEENKITLQKYWDFEFPSQKKHSEKFYEEGLKSRLEESIKLTLRSDVPVGVFLSGGIDSSVVTALVKAQERKVKTFSVTFEETLYSEKTYSRLAAKTFKTDHHELMVTKQDALRAIPKLASFLDEPFADSSAIPTYLISKFAKGFVKTVLTGEGGDELFAGYPWQKSRISGKGSLKDLLTVPSKMIFNHQARQSLYSAEVRRKIPGNIFKDVDIDLGYLKKLNTLDQYLYLDFKTYLPSDMLAKMDRMSMANSLEGRFPFLNHPLVEFVNSVPSSLKLKNGIRKYLLKKTFGAMIPKAILKRPKMGFSVPLNTWMWEQGKFRDFVYDVLFDSKTKRRGYFNYAVIEKMFLEHDRLITMHDQRIWTLLMFELWHRNFLDA